MIKLQFLPYLNLIFTTFCPNHVWPFVCPWTSPSVLKLGGWNFIIYLYSPRVDSWGRWGRPSRPSRPWGREGLTKRWVFELHTYFKLMYKKFLLHLPINRTKIANFDNKKIWKMVEKDFSTVTGFEPAISWFVVRRVIRCATRSLLFIMQFLKGFEPLIYWWQNANETYTWYVGKTNL